MKIPSHTFANHSKPVLIKPLKMSLDVNISEPDEFNCNELHSCIKEIAKIRDVQDFSYHVDFACGRGENYIANIFRVTIRESENGDKHFSVIVKTLINTTRQELFHELHTREVLAYEKVIKKFIDIQNFIDNEKRVFLPECLYTRIENGNEVIILEDLKAKGFEIDNRLPSYERLSYTQVSAVLNNLAKFHALSFIYEIHYAETFDKVKAEFDDIIFSNSFLNKSKLRNYFYDSFETSIKFVENLVVRKKLELVSPKLMEILQEYVKCRETSRNVLCHGDCWVNNVMFQNEDEEITKVCLIDFQAMRYSNPATDILHFIYLCTDSEFRTCFLQDILNNYYQTLESFLLQYDMDVNIVYTREQFDQDIEETKPFGLLMALIELKQVTTTPEDVLTGSMSVLNEDIDQTGKHDYYKIRVNDVVTESVNNGVLDKVLERLN